MRTRITNNMITNRFMYNMNTNLGRMDKLQNQLASGRRITRISDDPVGVVTALESRVQLYRLDNYKSNVRDAMTWNDYAETQILDMNEALKTAYENVVYAANDIKTISDKNAFGELIKQLRDHMLELANASMGERYIFGGFNTLQKPFEIKKEANPLYGDANFDPNSQLPAEIDVIYYNGIRMDDATDPRWADQFNQVINFEMGFGNLKLPVNFTGCHLMGLGDQNIFTILNDLYNDLMAEQTPNPDYEPAVKNGEPNPAFQAPYTFDGTNWIANPNYQGRYYPKLNPNWVSPGEEPFMDDGAGNTVSNPNYRPPFLDGEWIMPGSAEDAAAAAAAGLGASLYTLPHPVTGEMYPPNYTPEYIPDEITNEKIASYIPKLQQAQRRLLAIEAEVGGRSNRLEMMNARYDEDIITFTKRKSAVEDIDEAEVIMQFKMAEMVYQSALGSGARIIQPTLMDFLR